ncbi:MAG: Do family serine endopeptidase [Candidatus Symbiothrix sp.]|nr:Do family serine endopeptidase [Candidatus Symbiothrix sp.]
MKLNWKFISSLLLVSVFSGLVAFGVYSVLDEKQKFPTAQSGVFNQSGFSPVGYNLVAAESTDFTVAAERSVNAVVHIKSVAKLNVPQLNNRRGFIDPFEFFFGEQAPQYQRQPQQQIGFGSGVIISTDGYIVTNNHVIAKADEIEVITNDEQTYKAKLIGTDETTDVALLKIEGKNFPVIPFGDSDALKVGEWVLAVGNPFNLTSTVTAGIVSAKGRGNVFSDYGSGNSQDKVESFIQTDAAVNPGNSGGALVNTKGELVGINTAIYSQTGNYVGYSFAVPINLVKKVVTDIRQYGVVQRAVLGVSIIDVPSLKAASESNAADAKEYAEKYNKLKVKEGVYVDGFSSNSSAHKAGMQEGDVILAINGKKVKTANELKAMVNNYSPGDVVEVLINRDGKEKTLKVELKNDQGTTSIIKNRSAEDILGAKFAVISNAAKRSVGVNYGIEVTEVSAGKLKDAGIKEGFIILTANDTRLTSPEQFLKIVESVMKNDPDDRGLYIKGLSLNDRVRFYAIDLN